jgi:hypothetical protein
MIAERKGCKLVEAVGLYDILYMIYMIYYSVILWRQWGCLMVERLYCKIVEGVGL